MLQDLAAISSPAAAAEVVVVGGMGSVEEVVEGEAVGGLVAEAVVMDLMAAAAEGVEGIGVAAVGDMAVAEDMAAAAGTIAAAAADMVAVADIIAVVVAGIIAVADIVAAVVVGEVVLAIIAGSRGTWRGIATIAVEEAAGGLEVEEEEGGLEAVEEGEAAVEGENAIIVAKLGILRGSVQWRNAREFFLLSMKLSYCFMVWDVVLTKSLLLFCFKDLFLMA